MAARSTGFTLLDEPLFLDTNILVYASYPQLPLFVLARRRLEELEQAGARFWISPQIVREFLAASTRPGNVEPAPDAKVLVETTTDWLHRFCLAEEDAETIRLLLKLLEQPGAKGRQVHDANVVATMQRHGIRYLLTHNGADFERYVPLITLLPLEPTA
jgi:predicted nucleic acid-binding protein